MAWKMRIGVGTNMRHGKWVIVDRFGVLVPGEEMYDNSYDSQLRCDHINHEINQRYLEAL